MKSQFFRSCCVRGCAVLLGATLLLTSAGGMSPSALAESDAYKGTQYMSTATSAAQAIAQAEAVNQEIAEEGVVLLKNINSTLPLAAGKISVFGKNADPDQSVYGGSGSAASTGVGSYSLYDGLELGGFELNPALKAFYADAARSGDGRGSSPSMSRESTGYKTGETPVSAYDDDLKASFAEYGDAAVVMFSRVGGEGFDLPRESKDTEGRSDPTQHYLELDDNERDLLDMVCAQYSKVIVLINSGTSMELGDLEKDERIGAILWVSMPGASGFGPIGRILNGEVNPSGRTVDTWAADFKADPTWENFCKNNANTTKLDADGNVLPEYLDANGNVVTNQLYDESGALVTSKYQIAYEEGIYIGYRYWETRGYTEKAASGNDSWYREHVVYPMGFGLSYTTFTKEVVGMTLDGQPVENGYLLTADDLDKQITFTVKVTNTGSVPGKDVAQLYYSAPYYDEGIEKAHVVLADFAKTSLLAAGASEEITVSMKVRDMASYDYNDRNDNGYATYELDCGSYSLYVGDNANVWNVQEPALVLNVGGETANYDEDDCGDDAIIASIDAKGDPDMYDGAKSTNQYDEVSAFFLEEGETVGNSDVEGLGWGTELSRSDWEGTWPKAPTYADLVRTQEFIDTLNYPDPTKEGKAVGEVSDYDNGKPWQKTQDDLDAVLTVNGVTYPAYAETEKTAADDVVLLADFVKTITDENGNISYDITDWAPFLSQLTLEQMAELQRDGGFQITFPNMDVFGLDKMVVGDGGTGFTRTGISGYSKGCTYVSTTMVAATWNTELAAKEGDSLGNEAIWLDVQGLYGVGTNIHRTPFSGRNFEYFAEDPVLAGKMVASLTAAAQKRGLIMYDKHFFLNDTEQDRDQTGLLTYATEQTMREVYMKVEQIVVEEADAMALMTAFNRIGNVWVGEDYRTLTNILRGEWGFKGMTITDGQNGYMKNARMIRGGGDMALAMLGKIDMDVTSDWAKNDPTNIYALRVAAKNILYVVAQSNVMNHVTTYTDDTAARTDLGCYMPGDNVDADKLTVASDLFDGVVYELCDGKLPEGLTLNADGTVTGTVAADTADGVYSFKVAVKDGDEFIGWQVAWFQITVGELKQVDNYVGVAQRGAYFQMYVQSGKGGVGNNPALVYTLGEGSNLPEGLSLTQDGTIEGLPTETGRFTAVITATDPADGASVTYPAVVYVKDYIGDVTYTAVNLPAAKVGEYYCVSVGTATTADYTSVTYTHTTGYALVINETGWEVKFLNFLPDGLKLYPNGIIAGVPTTATAEEGVDVTIGAHAAGYNDAEAAFHFVVNSAD